MMIGKPCIFIPLPTAAEDHQTKNTQNLIEKNAAIMIKNESVKEELFSVIENLAHDFEKQKSLGENLKSLSKPNATRDIVKILFEK
jgi:UDP-N-acetylglucosamine--N-acetylmuramyl-(pentapeptide) pyrophosphoryl-undecaprenol N-acetylglucosamine transferase